VEINPKTGEPVWLFPFEYLSEGDSFFIPTLNQDEMVSIVMDRAKAAGVKIRAYPTTHDKIIGIRVWRLS
jgi:hypothetical protein